MNSGSSTAPEGGGEPSANGTGRQQANNSEWRCEFLVDSPVTREFMQGPLNIHLPPIQLPSGITSLVAELTLNPQQQQQRSQIQRQQSVAATVAHVGTAPSSPATAEAPTTGNQQHQNNIRQPQQAPQQNSPSSIGSWGRAASTPATLNSSSCASSAGTDSFVIDMSDEQTSNRIHRRRSSSPLRPVLGRSQQYSSLASSAAADVPTHSSLTQRTAATASSAADANPPLANGTAANDGNENGGNDGDGDDDMRNLRMRFAQLLRRRHQIFNSIVRETGQFPGIAVVAVFLSTLIVIFTALLQFFAIEFTASLALLFAVFHYSDAASFKRYVSGTGNGWIIAAKVFLRQFMLLQVLGQSIYVFPALAFTEVAISGVAVPSFWSTLYIVIIAEFFVMDCLLWAKLIIANLPKCSTASKRRVFQWLEYTAALYRYALPLFQWIAYFSSPWFVVLYGGIKILMELAMAWAWLITTLRIFRCSHLGTAPTETERKQNDQCTICFSEFTSPIKLSCSHIFCSECIRTWLDREQTCPICRAVVTKEDNHYRNGDSMFPVFF